MRFVFRNLHSRTRVRLAAVLLTLSVAPAALAQRSVTTTDPVAPVRSEWSLEDAIRYALEHNISIQQNELNARLAKLTMQQSQLAQIPSANVNSSYGRSFGRSINPNTNLFVDGGYDFLSLSGNVSVLVFGWFQQRNTIAKNKYSWQASRADLDQLKNDISLNVATAYLRILLAGETVRVNEQQVNLSQAQLVQTRSFSEAGRVPELNVAQLEAQVATDSSTLIASMADYTSSVLDMKALLNLDFEVPFLAVIPDIPFEERIALQNLQPEYIYESAVKNFASVKSSDLKVKSAEKALSAAKGNLYPQLTLNGQLGTNWTSNYQTISGYNTLGDAVTPYYVLDGSGNKSYLYQPTTVPITSTMPFGTQLNNNFRQTFSVGLSIPLFNAWQAQYSVKQARINVQSQELNKYQTELKLKQDVYKAYNDATNAVQKFYAAKRSQEASQRAFEFAAKRYELGLTNTVDYLIIQNNKYKAEGSLLSAKYDLIFKLKVIDYYLGKELKL